jgi:uncharacterized repeat protein (TIGR03803 family)
MIDLNHSRNLAVRPRAGRFHVLFLLSVLIAALAVMLAGQVTAQNFTTVYSFTATRTNSSGVYTNRDGSGPIGLILSGKTLYGTTSRGESSGNGTVFSISFTPPQLSIIPSELDVILSWPTNYAGFDYTGYRVQSTTNLVSPVWTTNLPAPVVVNQQNTVTNPMSGTQQFFRLSQ